MTGALLNHLWQSTLFALAAALMTAAFRRNRARVRYWLWLSASFKFFVPFWLMVTLGSQLQRADPKIAPPAVSLTIEQVTRPFPGAVTFAPTAPGATDWVFIAIAGFWACGLMAIRLMRLRDWGRIRAAVRCSNVMEMPAFRIPAGVEVRAAAGLLEPGVVGLWRPILLLPAGIRQRLTPAQMEAVLAHELCHIRRRDNLFAAIHMLVEAVFWFHPLVWWIGARLVEERERACDEEVLRLGSDPCVYAQGILNVCKLYVEAPLACVSGVTGSNLRKRIAAIMTGRVVPELSFTRKLLLGAAGVAAVGVPVAIGILNPLASRAQSPSAPAQPTSYVASIKPNKAAEARAVFDYSPQSGRFNASAVNVRSLLRSAYRMDQLVGAPGWLSTKRYDISAKVEGRAPDNPLFLQTLLADRFKLVVHKETRDQPRFALVLARGDGKLGPRLLPSDFDCAAYLAAPRPPPDPARTTAPCTYRSNTGSVVGKSIPIAQLIPALTLFAGRSVVDKTGLAGLFDVELTWAPEQVAANGADDSTGPSLFTALPEQLGLKLVSEKGPVEVLVVDHVEEPSEN